MVARGTRARVNRFCAEEVFQVAGEPIFIQEQLLRNCGGDAELAAQVATVFLADTPKQLAKLDEALAARDAKTAERVAHTIKSSAATVGGAELRESAWQCEQLGREAKLEQLQAKAPDLRDQFQRLEDALKKAGY